MFEGGDEAVYSLNPTISEPSHRGDLSLVAAIFSSADSVNFETFGSSNMEAGFFYIFFNGCLDAGSTLPFAACVTALPHELSCRSKVAARPEPPQPNCASGN